MASKRNVRRKQCKGKKKYDTLSQATAAAYSLKLKTSENIHGYGCGFCGGFHVGHTKKGWRRKE